MKVSFSFYRTYLLITFISSFKDAVEAGCLKAKLCCRSRNASCMSTENVPLYRNVYGRFGKLTHSDFHSDSDFDRNSENDNSTERSTLIRAHVAQNVFEPDNETIRKFFGEENENDTTVSGMSTTASNRITDENDYQLQPNSSYIELFEDFDDPSANKSGVQQDTVEYQDMDYGSGEPVSHFREFTPLHSDHSYNDTSQTKIHKAKILTEKDVRSYYDSVRYDFGADTNRNHQRRHATEVRSAYSGRVKAISYVIVGGKASIAQQAAGSNEEVMFSDAIIPSDYSDDSGSNHITKQCYCDEECLFLNDCCSDYVDACPIVDCSVTAWSAWGPCQVTKKGSDTEPDCGPGIGRRTRKILTESQNGGALCPHLEDQKACYNADPKDLTCGSKASELALLLPYIYNTARQTAYKSHVYYVLPKDQNKNESLLRYCSTFTITWSSPGCLSDDLEFPLLGKFNMTVNQSICVQCESAAQKQDTADRYFHGHAEDTRDITGQKPIVPISQEIPEHQQQTVRCSGDGVPNTETLWSLISLGYSDAHSTNKNGNCFGHWLLISKSDRCLCERDFPNHQRFIFV